MSSILFRNGVIHSPAAPFAQAVLIEDGVIAWLGDNDSADGFAKRAQRVVDLDGALVAPGFVDAHVHLLATGLRLAGLDLSPGVGVRSGADLLGVVQESSARAQQTAAGAGRGSDVLSGHGWDESEWTTPDLPSHQELDAAAGGVPTILVRTDVHSSLVSSSFADAHGLAALPGWDPSGALTGHAHERALAAMTAVAASRHTELTDLALRAAAQRGIVAVHEMSAPGLDTRQGLAGLIARTVDPASGLPQVIGYRGELCRTVTGAEELRDQIPGLTGIGGDLRVDGSIGSHTAALEEPFADHPGAGGADALLLSAEQIAAHVSSAHGAGLHAAFHVIGDRAMTEALNGLAQAAEELGSGEVQGKGHRMEHAEMIAPGALAELVRLGVGLSMQPAFDAAWGASGGLYETRLGSARAAGMNAFASLAAEGIPLGFGSDTPVTPFAPWGGVRAAWMHHTPEHRISAREAFRAHTLGGWRLAGLDHTGAGELRVGAPAHLAVWTAKHLGVQGVDTSTWSTDARAGTPLLPDLSPGAPEPRCVLTMRSGELLFDGLGSGTSPSAQMTSR